MPEAASTHGERFDEPGRPGTWGRIRKGWGRLDEWVRSFVIALLLLTGIHVFVVRWVVVESTSMYATLAPGDLVLVQRWPLLTGFSRNDVIVFRDPLKSHVPLLRRPLLVKRIAAGPGDVLRITHGMVEVNEVRETMPERSTRSYVVRLRSSTFGDSLMRDLGLPSSIAPPGRMFVEVPLNADLARDLEKRRYVRGASPLSLATGAPRHIFPFSPRYPWNGDNYGPIRVPAQGDTLRITTDNLPLYDRLISVYEGHQLHVDGGGIYMDGAPLKTYVVEQDYYFVLGDARHHSADSRYWGFVPRDHVTGRAGPLIWGGGTGGAGATRILAPL